MDKKGLLTLLEEMPVIASVKDERGLTAACQSGVPVVFLLYGDVLSLPELTNRVHQAGKAVLVHMDMIEGLAPRDISVDFVCQNTPADGIISTKSTITRRARDLGLVAIERFFMLDSMAVSNIERHLTPDAQDLIEVLPGAMPKVIRRVCAFCQKPVIAGGLIVDKEDVTRALRAGAIAVSSSNPSVWSM